MLFFDDLVLDQRFTTQPYVVTPEELDAFERQYTPRQYDPNMSYRPWASPWHAAALSGQMLAEWAIDNQLKGYWHDKAVRDLQLFRALEPGETLRLELRVTALPDASGYVVGNPEFEVRMFATGRHSWSKWDADADEVVDRETLRYRTTLSVDKRERMRDYPSAGSSAQIR